MWSQFEALLGSATLAAAALWVLHAFGKRIVDSASGALVRALKNIPWRRAVIQITGREIKASNDKFCLVICSLLNDTHCSHGRYISSLFSQMRNIDVIIENSSIPFASSDRIRDIEEHTKKLASSIVKRHNGDV